MYCLTGICQRNTQDYSQLIIVSKDDIQEDIHSFFVDIIDGNFGPRNSSCKIVLYVFVSSYVCVSSHRHVSSCKVVFFL